MVSDEYVVFCCHCGQALRVAYGEPEIYHPTCGWVTYIKWVHGEPVSSWKPEKVKNDRHIREHQASRRGSG